MIATAHADAHAGGGCWTGKAGSPSQVPRDANLSPGELTRGVTPLSRPLAEKIAELPHELVTSHMGCRKILTYGCCKFATDCWLGAADSSTPRWGCLCQSCHLVAVGGGLVGAVHRDIDVDSLILCESGQLGAQLRQVQRGHLQAQDC